MEFLKDNLKRHEIKFVLNQKEKINFINNSNLKNLFPDRIVESVYFDTKDLKLFSLSEEGITPRIKIRIRIKTKRIRKIKRIKKTKTRIKKKMKEKMIKRTRIKKTRIAIKIRRNLRKIKFHINS